MVLLFGGDIMMDRYIRLRAGYIQSHENPYSYFIEELLTTIQRADATIANLEGAISNFESVSIYSDPKDSRHNMFTMSPEVFTALGDARIRYLNIGNNHILDFGDSGVQQTLRFAVQSGISVFGDIGSAYRNSVPQSILFQKGSASVVVINYNQFSPYSAESVLYALANTHLEVDWRIVYCHWGIEFDSVASGYVQDLAYAFASAGADLIIGSHPHVIQQKENYAGATIYYSLGNLVFDQYFAPEVRKGLLLMVRLANGAMELQEIPVRLHPGGKTYLEEIH